MVIVISESQRIGPATKGGEKEQETNDPTAHSSDDQVHFLIKWLILPLNSINSSKHFHIFDVLFHRENDAREETKLLNSKRYWAPHPRIFSIDTFISKILLNPKIHQPSRLAILQFSPSVGRKDPSARLSSPNLIA